MRKSLMAVILCLALCLMARLALAEPTVSDVTFEEGGTFTLSGSVEQPASGYVYFAEIYGVKWAENGERVINPDAWMAGKDWDDQGKFTFTMSFDKLDHTKSYEETEAMIIPGSYALILGKYVAGDEDAERDFEHPQYFTVQIGDEGEQLAVITVTGLSDDGTVPINRNIHIRVEAQGAQAIGEVELFDGSNFWDPEGVAEDGAYTGEFSFTEELVHSVYARVAFEDQENYPGWKTTNVIWIPATKVGDVGELTCVIDPQPADGGLSLTRGDVIGISYEQADNADHYWTDFERLNADGESWDWVSHQGDVNDPEGGHAVLSTAVLEAGTYRFCACASGEGYTQSCTEYTELVITEPQASEVDPVFTYTVAAGPDGVISTGQRITVTAYAPEAGWIDVVYNRYEDIDWRDSFDTAFREDMTPYWGEGTYYMVLEAYFPVFDENGNPVYETDENGNVQTDEEGNPVQTHYLIASDPVVLTVQADAGTIDIQRPELPSYLAPGAKLDITLPMIDGGEWMNLEIQVMNGDGSVWDGVLRHEEADENGISCTVFWEDLLAFGIDAEAKSQQTLVISANGGRIGYEVRGWQACIPIVNVPDGTDTEAVMVFDQSERAEFSAPVNTEVTLTVLPKADRTPAAGEEELIQRVRIYDGWTFRADEQADEDGVYHTSVARGDAGTCSLYAEATYMDWNPEWDGLEEDPRVWYPTNVLTVHFTDENGAVNPFAFSLSPEDGIVARGDTIQVSVHVPTGNDIQEEKNATDYYVAGLECDWRWTDRENWIAEINTTNMEPGTYAVSMTGTAAGLASYYAPSHRITVTDPDMGGEVIRCTLNGQTSGIEAWLGESLELSALAPGALRMGVYVDGEPWHLDKNGNYQWGEPVESVYNADGIVWRNEDEIGEHQVRVIAQFEEDGEWEEKTLTVTVRSKGKLAFNRTEIPACFEAKDPTADGAESFTVSLPENADMMRIMVCEERDTGNTEDRWELANTVVDDQVVTDGEFVVQIPYGNLTAGNQIWMDVQVEGIGYPVLNEHFEIPVIRTPAQDGALMVFEENGPDSQGIVLIDKGIAIALIPPEGRTFDQVRFWHGIGYWFGDQDQVNASTHPEWFREEDHAFVANWAYDRNQLGNHAFFAEYLLDGDKNWYVTEPVSMTVTALGEIGAFDFTDDQEREISVPRGTPVTLRFSQAEAGDGYADQYLANALSREDDEWKDPAWHNESGTEVVLYTDMLAAGTYEIWGRAEKTSWIGAGSGGCVLLHLTEPAEKTVSLNLWKTELLTQEETEWYVSAPGATSILVEGYMLGTEGETNYFFQSDNSEWEETDHSFICGRNNFGGHEGTAWIRATATFEDGSTATAGPLEITVTAPYGSLRAFKLHGGLYDGGDISFTVEPDSRAEWYRIEDIWMHDENTQSGTSAYRTPDDAVEQGTREFSYSGNNAHIGVTVYQAATGYNDDYTVIWLRPLAKENILDLPAGLTEIEEDAFSGNPVMAGVRIPDSLSIIGSRAFDNCGALWAVEIPSSVTEIGSGAFMAGNVTVYGYSGSEAERIAQNERIDFVYLD